MAKVYRFGFKHLDVYQASLEHFAWVIEVTARMPRGPFVVTNQAVSASLSILSNLGEANGRDTQPGEVEQHYRYAQGSTFESATHLDALSVLHVVDDEEYNAEEERLARIAAMLTRLMQRHRNRRGAPRRRPRAQGGTARRSGGSGERSEPADRTPNRESARSAVPAERSEARDRTPSSLQRD